MEIAFFIINAFISLAYGLLAVFFARRVKLPPGDPKAGWRTIIALIFASLFFIGCAHTHADLAYHAYIGELHGHWFSPLAVTSHALQGIGGLGFLIFASLWVKITIFDKKDFEKEIVKAENGGERHSTSD
jgi:hypothetical protein